MFGLMKISTHEAEMQLVREALGYGAFRYSNPIELARQVRDDRDNWKQSESACNTRYEKLQAVNVALKARIAELEKPVPLPKRKPVGKASPVTETVKVPVKGKVK